MVKLGRALKGFGEHSSPIDGHPERSRRVTGFSKMLAAITPLAPLKGGVVFGDEDGCLIFETWARARSARVCNACGFDVIPFFSNALATNHPPAPSRGSGFCKDSGAGFCDSVSTKKFFLRQNPPLAPPRRGIPLL